MIPGWSVQTRDILLFNAEWKIHNWFCQVQYIYRSSKSQNLNLLGLGWFGLIKGTYDWGFMTGRVQVEIFWTYPLDKGTVLELLF